MTASNFKVKPIKVKMSKCKHCKTPFEKKSMRHRSCSWECELELMKWDKRKLLAKKDKEAKIKLRTKREWTSLAQQVFNSYIRARDKDKTCICCGLPLVQNTWGYDCGHYRSVGSAPHLRFEPNNAHGQRKQCNRYGLGRAVDYRLGLIKRIGLEAVEALEADQTPRKYTIEQLQGIIKEYKQKLKEL